jgi:hypothetical protein
MMAASEGNVSAMVSVLVIDPAREVGPGTTREDAAYSLADSLFNTFRWPSETR